MTQEFKIGDIVQTKLDCKPYYLAEHKCTLVDKNDIGGWWGDFNNQHNSYIHKDGVWCVGFDDEIRGV